MPNPPIMDEQNIRLLARLETKMDAIQESFREFKQEVFSEFKHDTHERIEKIEKKSEKVAKKVWMIMGGIATANFLIIVAVKLA